MEPTLRRWCGALLAGLTGLLPAPSPAAPLSDAEVRQFASDMAGRHGLDAARILGWLQAASVRDDILTAIANPAEAKPWRDYRPVFVNEQRIEGGLAFWSENAALLERAEQRYGVPPHIVVGIIGVETRYGFNPGRYNVVESVGTLAFHYPPRATFFRSELEQLMLLARDEDLDLATVKGSYAGAMGKPQFIASSYRAYAVDFDDDGRRDLFNSNADVIGSVANYFARHRWRRDEPVIAPVQLDRERHAAWIAPNVQTQFTLRELRQAGVVPGGHLPDEWKAAPLQFDGEAGPEYWLALHNFSVITRYNRSVNYALAVYQLGSEIALRRGRPL